MLFQSDSNQIPKQKERGSVFACLAKDRRPEALCRRRDDDWSSTDDSMNRALVLSLVLLRLELLRADLVQLLRHRPPLLPLRPLPALPESRLESVAERSDDGRVFTDGGDGEAGRRSAGERLVDGGVDGLTGDRVGLGRGLTDLRVTAEGTLGRATRGTVSVLSTTRARDDDDELVGGLLGVGCGGIGNAEEVVLVPGEKGGGLGCRSHAGQSVKRRLRSKKERSTHKPSSAA